MKIKKIIVLSIQNPLNVKTWSGIPYFIIQSLKEKYPIIPVYLKGKYKWIEYSLKVIFKVQSLLFNQKIDYSHSSVLSRYYAWYFSKQIKLYSSKDTIVLAPAGSSILCFLKTSLPIVYLSDTTFKNMINYYPNFTNLSEKSIKEGNFIEQKSLEKATLCLFPSQWAAQSAINDYHIPQDKIKVIPLGANLIEKNFTYIPKTSPKEKCYLLFLAVNWERKGGDIVLSVYQQLKAQGYSVHLQICGCVPPFSIEDHNINIIPFINKNNPTEYQTFKEIMYRTHFLVLPTKAECYGLVFCEASAYSIPSITYNTGGVSAAVRQYQNGILLPVGSPASAFVNTIKYFINNENEYYNLSKNSYILYKNELNWDNWRKQFEIALQEHLNFN